MNHPRRRRKPTLLALLLALALVAAACGSDDGTVTEVGAPAQSDDSSEEDAESEDDAMEDESMEDEEAMEDESMEDGGTVTVTIENISAFPVTESGVFAVPAGGSEPGPALPGDAYEVTFYANPGQRLSFATMFVQSNDWFFAPSPEGIELFDADGNPVTGNVTDQVYIFDSGTEVDQAVGEGADQAPRQAGPDTGADDPDPNIRQVEGRTTSDYVGVTLEGGENGQFTLRIANDSSMALVPTPLAPGVYAVHDETVSLFATGAPDAGNGLEALAEDGDAAPFGDFLATVTGTPTPIAPGVWATHDDSIALYELGAEDAGLGLEALAEDGDPSVLAGSLDGAAGIVHSGVFNTPDGASEPGPVLPGGSYSFEVPVTEGAVLSFATMFVQSNDWTFMTPAGGLDLASLDGDITDQLLVIDPGTEIDQLPGFGPDQAPRQAGPDTGADDPDTTVRVVEDRTASRYIKVTVTT